MDQKAFQSTLRRTFWIPFGIAVILSAVLILEVRLLMERAAWVDHTDHVISISQRLYRIRIDEETALRAYVLTRDAQFLDPFYQSREQARTLEPDLRQLIADNPEQADKNEKASKAFEAWSSWADTAIAMKKAGQDTANVKFQLQGKELMDQYRRVRTEFIDREQELRDERLVRSRRTLDLVYASIVGLAVFFALGFAALGRKQLLALSQSFTRALNAAKEQRDWLHTTLTSIGDAVIATDAEGRITLMNSVAQNLTGWTLSEAQGKPLSDVFHIVNEETRRIVENPVDKVRRLKHVVGLANHTILIHKDGQEISIDDSAAPIFGPDGVLRGIVLVFRDITEQVQTEKAQRALEAALQSNERLALAGRLSASIAHEIHNPLDTVENVLFLLAQQLNGKPESHQLITTGQQELQRVTEISRNMLSLHRESRAATSVKLSEFLKGVAGLVDKTVAKGHRKIVLLPGFEKEVEAFASELRQVFTNVLKNAVEATAEDGEIRIYSEPTQHEGIDGVVVRIVDNGVGVPAQMQSKLFTPFVSTKEESGTGLGLWVSRSILERHGGTIHLAANDNNQGTTVSIFLPRRIASRKSANLERRASAHNEAAD